MPESSVPSETTVTSRESYLSFFGTRRTEQCGHVLLPHLVDESSEGDFRITVCVYVHKVQTVVPQQGRTGVHLLHGNLYGRTQPQGAEGQGHVPGSLEAYDQLAAVRATGAVTNNGGGGQRQREVEHGQVTHAGGTHCPPHHSHPVHRFSLQGLNSKLPR